MFETKIPLLQKRMSLADFEFQNSKHIRMHTDETRTAITLAGRALMNSAEFQTLADWRKPLIAEITVTGEEWLSIRSGSASQGTTSSRAR